MAGGWIQWAREEGAAIFLRLGEHPLCSFGHREGTLFQGEASLRGPCPVTLPEPLTAASMGGREWAGSQDRSVSWPSCVAHRQPLDELWPLGPACGRPMGLSAKQRLPQGQEFWPPIGRWPCCVTCPSSWGDPVGQGNQGNAVVGAVTELAPLAGEQDSKPSPDPRIQRCGDQTGPPPSPRCVPCLPWAARRLSSWSLLGPAKRTTVPPTRKM